MFEMFTPAKLGQHRLFFTCAWTFIVFAVFWYMIGEFPYYEAVQFPDPQTSTCLSNITSTPMGYASSQMVHWINQVGDDLSKRTGHDSCYRKCQPHCLWFVVPARTTHQPLENWDCTPLK